MPSLFSKNNYTPRVFFYFIYLHVIFKKNFFIFIYAKQIIHHCKYHGKFYVIVSNIYTITNKLFTKKRIFVNSF